VAFDAWLEVRKLDIILNQRRAALGMPAEGAGHVTRTAEARLRADVAFVEGELALHREAMYAAIAGRADGVVRSRLRARRV